MYVTSVGYHHNEHQPDERYRMAGIMRFLGGAFIVFLAFAFLGFIIETIENGRESFELMISAGVIAAIAFIIWRSKTSKLTKQENFVPVNDQRPIGEEQTLVDGGMSGATEHHTKKKRAKKRRPKKTQQSIDPGDFVPGVYLMRFEHDDIVADPTEGCGKSIETSSGRIALILDADGTAAARRNGSPIDLLYNGKWVVEGQQLKFEWEDIKSPRRNFMTLPGGRPWPDLDLMPLYDFSRMPETFLMVATEAICSSENKAENSQRTRSINVLLSGRTSLRHGEVWIGLEDLAAGWTCDTIL